MTTMYFIMLLSMFFWLFPPIRQYKTDLFWYFFILAISDPISVGLSRAGILSLLIGYAISGFILIFSLYGSYRKNWHVRAILLILFIMLIPVFFMSSNYHYGIFITFHITILFFFLWHSVNFIGVHSKLNIFTIMLVLYELSLILKVVTLLSDVKAGVAFFFITDIFQMLIAVFFTIFKENDSRLFINLKTI